MDLELLDVERSPSSASRATAPARSGAGPRAAPPGFDAMTDLPLALRERARATRCRSRRSTLEHEAHARDGTVKALFGTADGRPVEAVLMRYRDGRRSLCLSLAVGLPADLHVLRHRRDALRAQPDRLGDPRPGASLPPRDEAVDHAVFMGMGEPMMNLDAVLGACERLPDDRDHATAARRSRRSAGSRGSSGWPTTPMPLRLALSLHAADDALRSELMPVNDRYPLADVLDACRAYYARKRRKVFVEYVMLAGVNDSHRPGRGAGRAARPRDLQGQPDPVQPHRIGSSQGSSPKAIEAFKAELERHGSTATVRLTRGRDIDAACGQLAARAQSTESCPEGLRGAGAPDSSSHDDERAAQPRPRPRRRPGPAVRGDRARLEPGRAGRLHRRADVGDACARARGRAGRRSTRWRTPAAAAREALRGRALTPGVPAGPRARDRGVLQRLRRPGATGPGAYEEIDFHSPLAMRIAKDWSYMGIGAMSERFEVVVVGSGAGGGVVAGELAARGRSVLLLEAGGHHTAEEFVALGGPGRPRPLVAAAVRVPGGRPGGSVRSS